MSMPIVNPDEEHRRAQTLYQQGVRMSQGKPPAGKKRLPVGAIVGIVLIILLFAYIFIFGTLSMGGFHKKFPPYAAQGTVEGAQLELSDPAEELKNMAGEKARLEKEIARSNGILSNEGFLKKAPEAKVKLEKDKLEVYKKQYQTILDRIAVLNG